MGTRLLTAVEAGGRLGTKKQQEGRLMLDESKRRSRDSGDRKAVFLEFVAASAILSIVVLVLYMVFTYKPA